MSLHKLQDEREARDATAPGMNVALNLEVHDIASAIARARAMRAIDFATRNLPVHRLERWSARRKVADLFDDFALDAAFTTQRISMGSVLMSAPGVFVHATGHNKTSYCSCWFQIWAECTARADEVIARIKAIAGEQRVRDETFVLDWQFTAANGDLRSASFEELADASLLDEAYPSLGMPVTAFIGAYLTSSSSVLILLGPPGTGKTRLVRSILAEMTRRKGENAEVMYTSDKRALGTDEVFVDFITGSHDAFVIEDTDHLLKARTSGNEQMHRFLAIADGVARAQGRKIIFTTNLPNVTDIDDALIRPGRCFAVKNLRNLELAEAHALARRICGEDETRAARAIALLDAEGGKSRSVAQVYRSCERAA